MFRVVVTRKFILSGTILLFGVSAWVIHRAKKRKLILNEIKSKLEKRMCFGRSEVVVSIIESETTQV